MGEPVVITAYRASDGDDLLQNAETTKSSPRPVRSDEELMIAYAGGRTDAFAELFARYRQPLYGFFRRRIEDAALAEELTQEAFLAVVRGAARYEPKALFRTYLYAIGLRMVQSYRRRKLLHDVIFGVRSLKHEPTSGLDPVQYLDQHVDQRSEQRTEEVIALRDAIRKLIPADREVVLLREFEELSYAEIAELLHLPVNTVRSRLFRARMALRDLLDPLNPSSAARQTSSGERKRK